MSAVQTECTIRFKTYEIKSPTGLPSTLKLCWLDWPLPDGLFPTSIWQHLRMGSYFACWRLADHD
jgi:hypothetical protein